MICNKMAPTHFEMGKILQEETKITIVELSITIVELSLSQSSHGKEVSLVKRSRTKFGRSAPCSSLSLKVKHRVHSETKANLK